MLRLRSLCSFLAALLLASAFSLALVPRLLAADEAAAPKAGQSPSQEGLMNKLLAPGKLMEGHKQLESTDCLSCHAAGNGVPDSKCLDCHKDIRQSIARPKSFHKLTNQPCFACHSDHKGRSFDALAFDTAHFDHAKTGFPLAPKHQPVKCVDCHTATREGKAIRQDQHSFFAKTATCTSCHVKDDPHSFPPKIAAKDCSSCHVDTSWKKQITFDHKKDAHWALKGAHEKTACVACHKPDPEHQVGAKKAFHWLGLKTSCSSCHADYHGFDGLKAPRIGKLAQCQLCHNEASWKDQVKFDHNLQTRYVLDGKHTTVSCNDCHATLDKSKALASKPPAAAESAHQSTLIGPVAPPLRQYHWDHLEKNTCALCHKSPHLGKFPPKLLAKPCTACHVTASWTDLTRLEKTKFDHTTLTKFPLTGKHQDISCKACHVKDGKDVYKFANADKQFCVSCHASVHKEQFSEKFASASCADCHGTKRFADLKPFDHKLTRFVLDGGHLKIEKTCVSCHVKVPGQMLATKPPKPAGQFIFKHPDSGFCADCHKNVHIGQFDAKFAAKECRECHTTDTFLKRKPFDHHATGYDVIGKHEPLACEKCHTPTSESFPPPSKDLKGKYLWPNLAKQNCAACHTDPHQGRFGARCTDCHTETAKWSAVANFHKNYTLTGVHNLLACQECHIKDRRLTGLNDNCQFCHRKDDNHNGGLPACGSCHMQQTWAANTFHHGMTDFPLIGAHRAAECNACHRSGVYQGTPTDCAGCHIRDAFAGATPNHKLPGFEQCSDCHNQFIFRAKK